MMHGRRWRRGEPPSVSPSGVPPSSVRPNQPCSRVARRVGGLGPLTVDSVQHSEGRGCQGVECDFDGRLHHGTSARGWHSHDTPSGDCENSSGHRPNSPSPSLFRFADDCRCESRNLVPGPYGRKPTLPCGKWGTDVLGQAGCPSTEGGPRDARLRSGVGPRSSRVEPSTP